jgi:hypothetical protein
MTIKQLKQQIENIPDNTEFVVSCDEELNTLYTKWEIAMLNNKQMVIYGLSGTEIEDNY